jgi:hypothetical protein
MITMDSFNKVRRGLKNADDLELPMNEDFFNKLHDKIMMEVESLDIAPQPMMMKQKNYLRAHWRGWLYSTGSVASVFLVVAVLSSQFSKVNESMQRAGLYSDGRERIVEAALNTPDSMAQTLISSQSEADFFVDVASESFENLTVAKFNKLMGDNKTTH